MEDLIDTSVAVDPLAPVPAIHLDPNVLIQIVNGQVQMTARDDFPYDGDHDEDPPIHVHQNNQSESEGDTDDDSFMF